MRREEVEICVWIVLEHCIKHHPLDLLILRHVEKQDPYQLAVQTQIGVVGLMVHVTKL